MRQRVKRAGFAELRPAFVRFGERHTSEFLQLDKEVEDFAEQVMTQVNPTSGYQTFTGFNAELQEQLDRIEEQANKLRGWWNEVVPRRAGEGSQLAAGGSRPDRRPQVQRAAMRNGRRTFFQRTLAHSA